MYAESTNTTSNNAPLYHSNNTRNIKKEPAKVDEYLNNLSNVKVYILTCIYTYMYISNFLCTSSVHKTSPEREFQMSTFFALNFSESVFIYEYYAGKVICTRWVYGVEGWGCVCFLPSNIILLCIRI